MGDAAVRLARWRVPLGFAAAIATLILARPTWESWRTGVLIAVAGEAIRVWAAGHLEKGREVTQSGPYRWTGHPLYVGSAIVAFGVVVASRSAFVALLAAVYVGVTFTAAIRTEEAFLRRTFGDAYDRYRQSRALVPRDFSLERAKRNREQRAIAGLAGGFALLALKILAPL